VQVQVLLHTYRPIRPPAMYVLKDRVFNVKWRSDFDKACVVVNFERRGWQKWKEVRLHVHFLFFLSDRLTD
jgi:hypothetical protein